MNDDGMSDEEKYFYPFHESLTGLPNALNTFRTGVFNLPPIESNRSLNLYAQARASHLMDVGIANDPGAYDDTLRKHKNLDISEGVELVRQWPAIRKPHEYLIPWVKHPPAARVIVGDYKYIGVGGELMIMSGEGWPPIRAIVVVALANVIPY